MGNQNAVATEAADSTNSPPIQNPDSSSELTAEAEGTNTKLVESGEYVLIKQKKKKNQN